MCTENFVTRKGCCRKMSGKTLCLGEMCLGRCQKKNVYKKIRFRKICALKKYLFGKKLQSEKIHVRTFLNFGHPDAVIKTANFHHPHNFQKHSRYSSAHINHPTDTSKKHSSAPKHLLDTLKDVKTRVEKIIRKQVVGRVVAKLVS